MILVTELLGILGSSAESLEWQSLVAKIGLPGIVDTSATTRRYKFSKSGLDFEYDCTEQAFFRVWVRPGSTGYTCNLVNGVCFGDSQEDVEVKTESVPYLSGVRRDFAHNAKDEWARYALPPYSITYFFREAKLSVAAFGLRNRRDEAFELIDAGRFVDAAEILEHLLATDKPPIVYLRYLEIAECYRSAKQSERAEINYLQAILHSTLDGHYVGNARLDYAEFLEEIGRKDMAWEQLLVYWSEKKATNPATLPHIRQRVWELAYRLGLDEEIIRSEIL